MNIPICSLHKKTYDYFCEQCYQPICKQCTILGPHNTSIHRVSQISHAYQRRVNQVKDRIGKLINESRNVILGVMGQQHCQIEKIRSEKSKIERQNEKFKTKIMIQVLKRSQENISEINVYKESLNMQLNKINDIGHNFESLETALQIVGTHEKVIRQLKECIDRIQISLSRKSNIVLLPKQLTDLRIALNKIEGYDQLYIKKITCLQQILKKSKKDIRQLKHPDIKYQQLLQQLSDNIISNCIHYVCHFCGANFDYDLVNTECPNNKVMIEKDFVGYCESIPQASKLTTRRHFFGKPKQIYRHFKNQTGSFKVHLEAIGLKLKTLMLLKRVNLQREFKKYDQLKSGFSQKIVFQYLLIQLCTMTVEQTLILLQYCNTKPNTGNYQYSRLIQLINNFQIELQ